VENREKWRKFFWGASPTLVTLALVFIPNLAAIGINWTFVYLIGGLIIAWEKRKADKREGQTSANPVISGILTGLFVSAILSATACFRLLG
jgi:hypothetical protein